MILLIIMLIILVAFMLSGYNTGIIKLVLSCVSILAALLLTYLLTPTIKDAFVKTGAYESIVDSVRDSLDKDEAFRNAADDSVSKVTSNLNLPKEVKSFLNDNDTDEVYDKLNVSSAKEYVAAQITNVGVSAATFAIVFIICFVLVSIIINTLDLISKLPVINEINKTAGLVVGFIEGLVVIWLAFIVINFLGTTQASDFLYSQIEENAIVAFVYNNNLLFKLFLYLIGK